MGLDNPLHVAFLLIVLLLVFGARRLPEMGRSIGAGMREFKDSLSGQSTHQPLVAPEQRPPATVDTNAQNQTSAAAAFGEQQRS
jgi:sec-independent protein translocase protein TatA